MNPRQLHPWVGGRLYLCTIIAKFSLYTLLQLAQHVRAPLPSDRSLMFALGNWLGCDACRNPLSSRKALLPLPPMCATLNLTHNLELDLLVGHLP